MPKKATTSKPFTLAFSRDIVADWDRSAREREADDAQTAYLEMLAWWDLHMTRYERSLRFRPKRERARRLEAERKAMRKYLSIARRRAERPTIYSPRVTGADICEASCQQTVPRESRGLSGIRGYTFASRIGGHAPAFGLVQRTESATLRSRDGRILATVLVAGAERDLFARLLATLSLRRQ